MGKIGFNSQSARLTICLSHADPQATPGPAAFAFGSPVLHEAWDRARQVVAEFDPELVVLFGPDHRRAFREVIPTVAVALAASGRGDRDGPTGDCQVPSGLARELATGLVERDIDVAVAYHPSLDHGFGLTAQDLLGGLDARAVIPVFLNAASPPVVTLRRAATIGRAVGDTLAPRAERILFVGSGGLTHDLPGFYPLDDGVDYSEEERLIRIGRLSQQLRVPGRSFSSGWDGDLLGGLAGVGDEWLDALGHDVAGRAGNGGNEAVTWVAAWAAGGQGLTRLAYEFNPAQSSGLGVAISSCAVPAEAER
jgi:2,3-dihydroxyphenylpropionate 1,2-dioxygenase